MPVQLLETGEEDSLLAVAQHIADLLNEGQVGHRIQCWQFHDICMSCAFMIYHKGAGVGPLGRYWLSDQRRQASSLLSSLCIPRRPKLLLRKHLDLASTMTVQTWCKRSGLQIMPLAYLAKWTCCSESLHQPRVMHSLSMIAH